MLDIDKADIEWVITLIVMIWLEFRKEKPSNRKSRRKRKR